MAIRTQKRTSTYKRTRTCQRNRITERRRNFQTEKTRILIKNA